MQQPIEPPLWQRPWFQFLLGSLVVLLVASFVVPAVLGLVYATRSVLLPVLIAFGLAYTVNPLVSAMQRRLRMPRWAGTITVMLSGLLAVGLVLLIVLPPMIAQGGELIEKLREVYPNELLEQMAAEGEPAEDADLLTHTATAVAEAVDADRADDAAGGQDSDAGLPVAGPAPADPAPSPTPVRDEPDPAGAVPEAGEGDEADGGFFTLPTTAELLDPQRVREMLTNLANRLEDLDWSRIAQFLVQSLDVGVGVVGSAVSFTSYLALAAVIIAFCFFFFSVRFPEITAWFVPLIPASHRNRVLEVLGMMDQSVAAFVRGRLIQSLIMAVILSVGWLAAGVPYWLLLGVLSGLLNLVPYAASIGWIAAITLASADAATGSGFTIWTIIWPSMVYMLAQGLDGWVIEPMVQGKATDLDPVTVLLVVLLGASLAGLLGMLLAIPAAACLKILAKQVVLPRLRELAAGTA